MTYAFVFLGEFGYELLNWQAVIRKFSRTLGPAERIVCCSRADLHPIYETAADYIDISDVEIFRNSQACCYYAIVPGSDDLYSKANLALDRELRATLTRLIHALYPEATIVFSSNRTDLNGCIFGCDRKRLGREADIYRRLDLNNNEFARIEPDLKLRPAIEDRLGFALSEPYVLMQSRIRDVVARARDAVPKEDLIRGISERMKVVLLSFRTGRKLDSYSTFDPRPNSFLYACRTFAEQACLIHFAQRCVFFTEGDFGSHIYVPPLLGKDVWAVAPRDVYALGSTPIEFWNRNVFRFGGQIIPESPNSILDEISMSSSHREYLRSVEPTTEHNLEDFYLWPRTPMGHDHQEKIAERVGVDDYHVHDPRSRPAMIIRQIKKLIKHGFLPENFTVLDIACGDSVVLWQIKKEFHRATCYGIDCGIGNFGTHESIGKDGVEFFSGFIQHLVARDPADLFDVAIMLNTYRGWESADLREHEQSLPDQVDAWFAKNARYAFVTATEMQLDRLQDRGFNLAKLGKGEDDSTMVCLSTSQLPRSVWDWLARLTSPTRRRTPANPSSWADSRTRHRTRARS